MSTVRSSKLRLAGAVVVLLVVLAGCTGGSGGAPTSGGGDSTSLSAGGEETDGGSYYADGRRVVVREASMRVEVKSFDTAFGDAREIARAHGGFVAGWDHDIERGWHGGTLTIRVPANNFSALRDDLAELGRLEGENVRQKDFTVEYRNRAARIDDLRQEKRALQRLLNRTDDVEEARRLHDDIAELRGQIQSLEQEQASVERREALSTVRLRLHQPEADRPPRNYQAAFGVDDAFLDAFYGGLTAVKYAIVFFGYAIPIGFAAVAVGAFGLVCFRLWQRLGGALDAVLPGTGPVIRRPRIGDRGGDDGDATDTEGDDDGDEGT